MRERITEPEARILVEQLGRFVAKILAENGLEAGRILIEAALVERCPQHGGIPEPVLT